MGAQPRGAYGFRLVLTSAQAGLPDLGPVEESASEVALEHYHAALRVDVEERDETRIATGRRAGSLLEVRRDPAAIRIDMPEEVSAEALVHPLLTVPISILARWRGDLTLHAGSFVAEGRAWAVVGGREAGKSTTLAELAQRGYPLMADDLLVLDGDLVRAGPTCVDLRPDVAERMPAARPMGEVGGRFRHRLSTPEGPASAPLGGIFLLEWGEGDAVRVEPVGSAEALQVIFRQEYIALLGPTDPVKVLELMEVPMWRVSRPRDWSRGEEAIDELLAVAAQAAG